jgi:transcriptional regulator with XRE-family HTH domain
MGVDYDFIFTLKENLNDFLSTGQFTRAEIARRSGISAETLRKFQKINGPIITQKTIERLLNTFPGLGVDHRNENAGSDTGETIRSDEARASNFNDHKKDRRKAGPFITIDFFGHTDVFNEVTEAAREQFRTPALFILWILSEGIAAGKIENQGGIDEN